MEVCFFYVSVFKILIIFVCVALRMDYLSKLSFEDVIDVKEGLLVASGLLNTTIQKMF